MRVGSPWYQEQLPSYRPWRCVQVLRRLVAVVGDAMDRLCAHLLAKGGRRSKESGNIGAPLIRGVRESDAAPGFVRRMNR
jgi:hypothetical protein